MAAAGGDTIVPTNWGGLIVTIAIVAIVAAATYFGMEHQFGHQGGDGQTDKSLSVKDVFSASAQREVAAAQTARVLTRADLEAGAIEDSLAEQGNTTASADDWDAVDSESTTAEAADEDWGSNASDDWDTKTDDWDSNDSLDTSADDSAQANVVENVSTAVKETVVAVKDVVSNVAESSSAAAAEMKVRMQDALSKPSGTVRDRPSAEALRDWWSDANGDLAVRFAGTLDRGDKVSDGVAVMFSETVNPVQGNQHMRLTTASGDAVVGQWKAARNPAMLIMEGLQPGRYQLAIDSAIS
ncbi:MAG: hypothetical protein ACSHXK_17395, partial [Oceanococcus sp.]